MLPLVHERPVRVSSVTWPTRGHLLRAGQVASVYRDASEPTLRLSIVPDEPKREPQNVGADIRSDAVDEDQAAAPTRITLPGRLCSGSVASQPLSLPKTNPTTPHERRWHVAHRPRRSHLYAGLVQGSGASRPMATGGRIAAHGSRCCRFSAGRSNWRYSWKPSLISRDD